MAITRTKHKESCSWTPSKLTVSRRATYIERESSRISTHPTLNTSIGSPRGNYTSMITKSLKTLLTATCSASLGSATFSLKGVIRFIYSSKRNPYESRRLIDRTQATGYRRFSRPSRIIDLYFHPRPMTEVKMRRKLLFLRILKRR
jgi:hypothetical protein